MSQSTFAKLFVQIFDSSIADDWRVRVVFQDMLILADSGGTVDITPEALARRTNLPIEIVRAAIPKLEAPDTSSRTPDKDGRRIVRLDAHRDWGWQIVNFTKYRESASKEMLRMAEAERKQAYRAKFGKSPSPTPLSPKVQEREEEGEQSQTFAGHVPDMSGTPKPTRQQPNASLPLSEIFDAWNGTEGIERCLAVSDKRRQVLKARLMGPFFVENWRAALAKVAQSSFCLGDNDRGWKASFDWFISRDSVTKIIEGKYDNQPTRQDPKSKGTFLI